MSLYRPAIVALSLLATSVALAQDTYTENAFDTMGPQEMYSPGWGFTIATGTLDYGDQIVTAQFESATRGTLATVFLPAFYSAGTGMLAIDLYEDAGDAIGKRLESWSARADSKDAHMYSFSGENDTLLVTGGKYWLGLRALPGSAVAWSMPDIWAMPAELQKQGLVHLEGPTMDLTVRTYLPGFRIETTPVLETVPEPASLAALGLGLVAAIRRRKRS